MRGTSSLHVKRTGDFGNAIEGMRIGDQFPSRYFAKNPELCNLRLLQQNLPGGDLSRCSKNTYSITSLASICIEIGTSIPRALAVFALMTNSNLVDCCTGKSEGFASLRMRPV